MTIVHFGHNLENANQAFPANGVVMPAYEASEAQNIFSELLDRAERGEEIIITNRGRPVMKLVPVEVKPAVDPDTYARRIEALRQQAIAWRKAQGQAPVSLEEALSWRHEGRR
jgi:prevent-host-death family protein